MDRLPNGDVVIPSKFRSFSSVFCLAVNAALQPGRNPFEIQVFFFSCPFFNNVFNNFTPCLRECLIIFPYNLLSSSLEIANLLFLNSFYAARISFGYFC